MEEPSLYNGLGLPWQGLASSDILFCLADDLHCRQRTTPSLWRDPPITATDLRIFVPRELRRLRLDQEGRHLKSTAYRIPSKSFSKVQVINTNVISVSAVKMRAVFPHSALVALPACLAPTRRFSRCPAMSPQLRSCFW